MRPCPLYDTRHHYPQGLYWRGYLYEAVPALRLKTRLMIVEDHDDHLIVSDYSHGGWHDRCKPTGTLYRVNRIDLGRPSKARMEALKEALAENMKLWKSQS